jgi:hypothetical protein
MSITIVSHRERPDLAESLCRTVSSDTRQRLQHRNFDLVCDDRPWTLLYMLRAHKFSQPGADYLFAVEDDKVVCGAGCYPISEIEFEGQAVSIVMSRMYTVPQRRVQWIGTKILRKLADVVQTPLCMVTFNHENKGIYLSLTSRSRGLVWPPIWHAFEPLGELYINYVDQWCAVAKTEKLRSFSV